MLKELALGIITGVLFISLIVMFCILLVKLYIKKIKNYTEQLYQKDLDFQKTLIATVIETQEQVLNNISQDLHDDTGQQLTYINFQLENLKLDSPELHKVLDPISHSLSNLSQSVRSISHSLNNQLVLQQDLVKAIEAEIIRLQKNSKVTLGYSFAGKAHKEFNANEKIIIYRIFQECINNCLKHANATEIKISIVVTPQFKMVISDNGKGFKKSTVINNKSLGLLNMNNRAASINYHLAIETSKGEGTILTLTEKT